MNIKKENISDLHELITIELDQEDYQPQVMKSLKDLKQKMELPGFRKKMIPLELINKKHGKFIRGEEISKLAEVKIQEYIRENELSLLFSPVYCKDKSIVDFDQEGNFSFSFEVGIRPEIRINYDEVKDVIYYKIIATDKEIDEKIMSLRNRAGAFSSTETIVDNDVLLVTVSYTDEEKTFISTLPLSYLTKETLNQFIGKNLHDEMDIDTTKVFISDTERSTFLKLKIEELETAPVTVHIKINSIHHLEPADIDAHFFELFFPDGNVTTETELREYIGNQLGQQNVPNLDLLYRSDVIEKLTNNIFPVLVLPDIFIKKYLIATANEKKTPEHIEEGYSKIKYELVQRLISEQIITDLNINVYYQEIVTYIENIVRQKYFGTTALLDENQEEQIRNYTLELMKEKDNVSNTVSTIVLCKCAQELKAKLNPTIKELSSDEMVSELKERTQPKIIETTETIETAEKPKAKPKAKPKPKAKAKDEIKVKDEAEVKDETKVNDEAEVKPKVEVKDKPKAKAKTKAEAKIKAIAEAEDENKAKDKPKTKAKKEKDKDEDKNISEETKQE
ncbi:MAG: trigger factor family protein [Bacteroidales bacterium]|jgi:trigger factor|nr:trigger factor family protein [Bacteroidales bacterium]